MTKKNRDYSFFLTIACIFMAVLSFYLIFSRGGVTLFAAILLALSAAILTNLFLTNWRKIIESLKFKQTRYALSFVLTLLITAGICIFVYLISLNNDSQIDTTPNKKFSLSPQTIQILENLKTDVTVYGFYGTYEDRFTLSRQGMDDILEQYTLYGNKFRYRLYNINKEPDIAQKYKISIPGQMIVTSMNGKGTDGKPEEKTELVAEISEEKITNAIIRVSREKAKKIYFLTGHGEHELISQQAAGLALLDLYLKNQLFETLPLNLSLADGIIPTDCDLLIIAGLKADLFPKEWKGILDYIKRGGNVLLLINPGYVDKSVKYFETLGVKIGRNIIVLDNLSQLNYMLGNMYSVVTTNYGDTEITKGFNFQTFFPTARTVEPVEKMPDGITANNLVSSEASCHTEKVEVQPYSNQMIRSGVSEKTGPVPIGVMLEINTDKWTPPVVKLDKQITGAIPTENIDEQEKRNEAPETDNFSGSKSPEAKLIIIGDSDFIINNHFAEVKGNVDFALNTIAWLTDEGDLISIRPNPNEGTLVVLSEKAKSDLFWIPVIIIPVLILMLGGSVRHFRKKRHSTEG
ncbi:MAG: GldG family protein [Acidobacteria bacterium]|nr:GldG family protein [Acidobacteriota bacterium]